MTAPAAAAVLALARAPIAPEQAGFRADRALAVLVPALSRRAAKTLFHDGAVRLNGKPARGSETVRAGDVLEFPDPGTQAGAASLVRAQAPRLTTRHGRQVARLFEDDALLILNKPTEIPIHKGQDDHSRRETLQDVLEHAYPGAQAAAADGADKGGEEPEEEGPRAPRAGAGRPQGFYFVHRLDMETSGCLVVAKTPEARDALIGAFQSREVGKVYWAIVIGEVPWERKTVTRPIAYVREKEEPEAGRRAPNWVGLRKFKRPARSVKKGVVLPEGSSEGKSAETTFSVEQRFRGYTLLRCEPRTGRTHQIRVHLQCEGFPLAYDALYGRRSPLRLREFNLAAGNSEAGERVVLNRLPLHAWKISFKHPRTGEELSFEAPLPGDLREFLRLLKRCRSRGGTPAGPPGQRHGTGAGWSTPSASSTPKKRRR